MVLNLKQRRHDNKTGTKKRWGGGTMKQNSSYRQHGTPTPTGSTPNNLYLKTFNLAGVPTLKGFNRITQGSALGQGDNPKKRSNWFIS